MSEESTRLSDPLIGETVGEYRIDLRLGSGGMGIVYRAVHSVIGKQVAIKVLRSDNDEEHVHRLLAEARTVSQLRHRGIADIFGFGTIQDGRPYIVMELLEGKPLDMLLRERGGSVGVPEALWIIEQALGPMGAAHASGVIHRDIKPSNFFIAEEEGGTRYLKILDFGLAKRRAANQNLTAVGSVLGTPDYMSPEQAQARPVTPASDIYSLGATAYELLTGSPPFDGASPMEIMVQHVRAPAPVVSARANNVPPEVDALIASMLEKDPLNRPASASELRKRVTALRRQLGREATSEFDAPMPQPRRSSGRIKAATAPPAPEPEPAPPVVTAPPQATAVTVAPAPPKNTLWYVLGGIGVVGVLAGVALLLLGPRGGEIARVPPPGDGETAVKDPNAGNGKVVVPPPFGQDAGALGDAGEEAVEPPADAGVVLSADAGVDKRPIKKETKRKPVVDNSLQARIKRNEAELRSRAKAGTADPVASALLKTLKDELAKNPGARDRIARDLKEWERRYLR